MMDTTEREDRNEPMNDMAVPAATKSQKMTSERRTPTNMLVGFGSCVQFVFDDASLPNFWSEFHGAR